MLIKDKNDILSLASEVFDIEASSILKLKEHLGYEFEEACKLMLNCKGTVIVTGMGKSGLIGRKIAATLSSTGTVSYFLHPAESTHGDSGIITPNDVVIAISNSGETIELLNVLPIIKRFNCKLIAMTGKKDSTLAKSADVVLDISVKREACPLNKAPTASTTVTLAMGDALAVCLLKLKGFTEDDFLIYHPSGALGRGHIYKVKDLMIEASEMPVVEKNMPFLDAVKYISDKKLGLTVVKNENNKLEGILTDGDIRRTLLKNIPVKDLKVQDVMTKTPKTVFEYELAAKALTLMEKYSITSLVCINENNEPLGIVHIHDLLKAKIA